MNKKLKVFLVAVFVINLIIIIVKMIQKRSAVKNNNIEEYLGI